MAWFITLALFWAIGSWIAKGVDKSNAKNYQVKREQEDHLKAVLGNIYTIAWKECMDIQWEFYQTEPDIPSGESFLSYYIKVRCLRDGKNVSLQQQSVINALIDLRKAGQEVVCVRNGEPQIVSPYRDYYIGEEAEEVRGILPPIYGPFNIAFASKCTDQRAQGIFKKIWNREVLGTNIVKWDAQTKDYF